jgi:cytoskeletal protein CcmA (bactofilin family)
MFSRSKQAPKAAPKPGKSGSPGLSFIGSEVVISGDIATSAQLHVDGRVDGSVRCAQLCQGATGVVAGDIHADDVRLAGLVEGTVSGKTVVLEASARVSGDISYETISIAAGARVDGRLARREALAVGEVLKTTPALADRSESKAEDTELFAHRESSRIAVG